MILKQKSYHGRRVIDQVLNDTTFNFFRKNWISLALWEIAVASYFLSLGIFFDSSEVAVSN